MIIIHLKDGDLEMSADTLEQRDIKVLRENSSSEINAEFDFICDYLPDFEQVRPEEIGALTSAPIISDGKNVWGYMDYCIKNFLEELAEGKSVVWQKG